MAHEPTHLEKPVAADEGAYRDGRWIPGRRLNGDENDQGRKWRFSPRGVHVARCSVYRYE